MGSTTSAARPPVDIDRIRIKDAEAPPPKRDLSLDTVTYLFMFILAKGHQGLFREEILERLNAGLPKDARLTARQLSGHLTTICKLHNTDMVTVRQKFKALAKQKELSAIKPEDLFDQPPELMRVGQEDFAALMRPESGRPVTAPSGQVTGKGGGDVAEGRGQKAANPTGVQAPKSPTPQRNSEPKPSASGPETRRQETAPPATKSRWSDDEMNSMLSDISKSS